MVKCNNHRQKSGDCFFQLSAAVFSADFASASATVIVVMSGAAMAMIILTALSAAGINVSHSDISATRCYAIPSAATATEKV